MIVIVSRENEKEIGFEFKPTKTDTDWMFTVGISHYLLRLLL